MMQQEREMVGYGTSRPVVVDDVDLSGGADMVAYEFSPYRHVGCECLRANAACFAMCSVMTVVYVGLILAYMASGQTPPTVSCNVVRPVLYFNDLRHHGDLLQPYYIANLTAVSPNGQAMSCRVVFPADGHQDWPPLSDFDGECFVAPDCSEIVFDTSTHFSKVLSLVLCFAAIPLFLVVSKLLCDVSNWCSCPDDCSRRALCATREPCCPPQCPSWRQLTSPI